MLRFWRNANFHVSFQKSLKFFWKFLDSKFWKINKVNWNALYRCKYNLLDNLFYEGKTLFEIADTNLSLANHFYQRGMLSSQLMTSELQKSIELLKESVRLQSCYFSGRCRILAYKYPLEQRSRTSFIYWTNEGYCLLIILTCFGVVFPHLIINWLYVY